MYFISHYIFYQCVTQWDHNKKLCSDLVIEQNNSCTIDTVITKVRGGREGRRRRSIVRRERKNEGMYFWLIYIIRQETEHQLSKLCSVIRSSSTLSPKQSAQDHSHSVSSSSSQQLVWKGGSYCSLYWVSYNCDKFSFPTALILQSSRPFTNHNMFVIYM